MISSIDKIEKQAQLDKCELEHGYSDSLERDYFKPDVLEKLTKAKDPIDIINNLILCEYYAIDSCFMPYVSNTRDTIVGIANNKESYPLVRIVSESVIERIDNFIDNCDSYGVYGIYQNNKDCNYSPRLQRHLELLKKFPDLANNDNHTGTGFRLDMIASNVCARFVGGQIEAMEDVNGRSIFIADHQTDNEFGINKDDIFLIRTAHDIFVEFHIERELGLPFDDIPLDVQICFLRFMIEANDGRYDRLIGQLGKINDKADKLEFISAFLALEFGDDFGDMVLTISENAEVKESNEIFKVINEFRLISKEFSSQFNDIDVEFSSGAEKSMNERLTDLLAIAAKVAENGKITVDTAPNSNNTDYIHDGKFDIEINSLDQVIESMNLFLSSQKILSAILNSNKTCVVERYENHKNDLGSQTYVLMNDELGIAQFHVRRFGASSYDNIIEHGNYSGTEATMSWSVNPVNPL